MKKSLTLSITLAIYLLNVIAALVIIYNQDNLIGDLSGFKSSYDSISYAFFLLTLSLLLITVIYNGCEKLKPIFKVSNHTSIPIVVMVLEVSFILYVYFTGFFIAGNNERAGSIISAFFVLVNIDVLVLIFLTHSNHSKYKSIIILLWVISFVQRGWISYLFILVLIFYLDRKIKKKKNWKIVFLAVVLTFSLPFIEQLKNDIRSGGQYDTHLTYIDSLSQQAMKIVSRIQTVSHISFIVDNIEQLQHLKNTGVSTEFYEENFSDIFIKKVNKDNEKYNTSDLLAKYISPELNSSWNVNPSLVGWILIQNDFYILPVMWVIFLCVIFTLLSKSISDDYHTKNMRWLFWLVFLFPGWIFQFSAVIFSMMIYIILSLLFKKKSEF